jgi:uncharacterized protein (DUF111 family)
MSDNDPTKDIGQKYETRPTFETILEEMRAFRAAVEKRFDSLDIRLDRIEGAIHETKSDFHRLRADFNEMRNAVKEHFPAIH